MAAISVGIRSTGAWKMPDASARAGGKEQNTRADRTALEKKRNEIVQKREKLEAAAKRQAAAQSAARQQTLASLSKRLADIEAMQNSSAQRNSILIQDCKKLQTEAASICPSMSASSAMLQHEKKKFADFVSVSRKRVATSHGHLLPSSDLQHLRPHSMIDPLADAKANAASQLSDRDRMVSTQNAAALEKLLLSLSSGDMASTATIRQQEALRQQLAAAAAAAPSKAGAGGGGKEEGKEEEDARRREKEREDERRREEERRREDEERRREDEERERRRREEDRETAKRREEEERRRKEREEKGSGEKKREEERTKAEREKEEDERRRKEQMEEEEKRREEKKEEDRRREREGEDRRRKEEDKKRESDREREEREEREREDKKRKEEREKEAEKEREEERERETEREREKVKEKEEREREEKARKEREEHAQAQDAKPMSNEEAERAISTAFEGSERIWTKFLRHLASQIEAGLKEAGGAPSAAQPDMYHLHHSPCPPVKLATVLNELVCNANAVSKVGVETAAGAFSDIVRRFPSGVVPQDFIRNYLWTANPKTYSEDKLLGFLSEGGAEMWKAIRKHMEKIAPSIKPETFADAMAQVLLGTAKPTAASKAKVADFVLAVHRSGTSGGKTLPPPQDDEFDDDDDDDDATPAAAAAPAPASTQPKVSTLKPNLSIKAGAAKGVGGAARVASAGISSSSSSSKGLATGPGGVWKKAGAAGFGGSRTGLGSLVSTSTVLSNIDLNKSDEDEDDEDSSADLYSKTSGSASSSSFLRPKPSLQLNSLMSKHSSFKAAAKPMEGEDEFDF